MFRLLFLLVTISSHILSSSFYDNPEQDPLPPAGPDSTEELHRKWDFEVHSFYDLLSNSSLPLIHIIVDTTVVGIFWHIDLRPPKTCQVLK